MTDSDNIKEIISVVVLGAGNLAWHLGHRLSAAGIRVVQVYNRTAESGELLAAELNTSFTNRLDSLKEDAGLYIIAVSDDAICSILDTRKFIKGQMVVHTAGSVALDVFADKAVNYGVLYPLQTFTKGKSVDFSQVPLLIEASDAESLKRLEHLALMLSGSVHSIDSDKRMHVHLAAVIASNFTNQMLVIAEKLLKESNLSFTLIKPLVLETVAKALFMSSPAQAQTGPALRGNTEVIEKHLSLLENHPNIKELYRAISGNIILSKGEHL